MPEEKRIDSEDGKAYTWDEISDHYWRKYKKWEISAYWDAMKPVKAKGKGKGKGKDDKKGGKGGKKEAVPKKKGRKEPREPREKP